LIPLWLLRGKAFAKKKLAEAGLIDPSRLPYNNDLIAFLQKEREDGRKLVLVTASDKQAALPIAEHLHIFDDVIASDGNNNLKGKVKSSKLMNVFGEKEFIYAGNDNSDLHVWRNAQSAIMVNTSRGLSKAVRSFVPVMQEFAGKGNTLKALVKALRPYQWVKNILVFVPIAVSEQPLDLEAFVATCLMFVALCLGASGLYLINDLMDLETDRGHPVKRRRPFASGLLPLRYGFVAPVMVAAASAIALSISLRCLVIVLLYMLISLLYSTFLKKQPLIDVFCLALLYTVRIIGGGFSSGVHISIWLLNFSGFFFLALAFLKRYAEYMNNGVGTELQHTRRGYNNADHEMLQIMGIGSSLISAVVFSLYINTAKAYHIYHHPATLWGIVPVVVYWQFRLWFAAGRGQMHDDPILYSLKDWVSYICVSLILFHYVLAKTDMKILREFLYWTHL
jgi:4-hydroxybenzoate polyprenyltransferase